MKIKVVPHMKQEDETEIARAQNLIWNLIQGGGRIRVDLEKKTLFVSPRDLALKFQDQIRERKPMILRLFEEANQLLERAINEQNQ